MFCKHKERKVVCVNETKYYNAAYTPDEVGLKRLKKDAGIAAAIGKAQSMLSPEVTLMMLIGIGVGTVGLVVFEPFREEGKIYDILYRLVQFITIGLMVYALWLTNYFAGNRFDHKVHWAG